MNYDVFSVANNPNSNEDVSEPASLSASTIGIAAGSAAGYILLVLILVVYCGYRRRKIRERKIEEPSVGNNVAGSVSGHSNHSGHGGVGSHKGGVGDSEILLATRMPNGSAAPSLLENGFHHLPKSRSSPTSSSTSTSERLQYQRSNLEYQSKLGSGVFGDVHLMKVVRSKNANELERLVVVKLFTNKDENVYAELLQEIDMYAKLDHPNVTKLIGICREKEPFMIVCEYLDYVRKLASDS